MLAWTNLAQGAGAFVAPLVASVLVGLTGPIPLMVAAGLFRLTGTVIIAPPAWRSFSLRPRGDILTPGADAPAPSPFVEAEGEGAGG